MGVREALATLEVPPVPPAQSSGGTETAQSLQGNSPGSPSSPEAPRGEEFQLRTYPCSGCGRYAFMRPRLCCWCQGKSVPCGVR